MPDYARRVTLDIKIDGHDVAGHLAPYLLDFTYSDNASGKADEVQLTLQNRDGKFSGEWLPKKGMEIEAAIICADWEEAGETLALPCGTFRIDEAEFSGPPDKVSIKAVSADLTGELRDTKKTRAWENMNLEGVAGQIASENNLRVYYSGPEHRFERQDQRNEGDISFLNRLCNDRSMACKVHKGMLILFDLDQAEAAEPVFKIQKIGEMYSPKSYSFRVSSANTGYTDAEVAYSDFKTGTTHRAKVKSAKQSDKTKDSRKTLTIQKRVENPEQAVALGKSELRKANSKEETSSIEIMGCPKIASGQTIELDGFGTFSGRYFVNSATHKVSGTSAYSTSLELSAPAPTEVENASDEISEAAEAAIEEIRQEQQAKIARVEIFRPGSFPLSDLAYNGIHKLIDLVEEARIKAQSGSYVEKIQAKTDETILCLADIAEAEAGRASNQQDRYGWLYLRDMLLKWLSADLSKEPENSPLMIKWDWLWKFQRVREAYYNFIHVPDKKPSTILNENAQKSLGDIIFNRIKDDNPQKQKEKREQLAKILPLYTRKIKKDLLEFNFINSSWADWESLYYTLRKVDGLSFSDGLLDGLTVALSSFTLRALAVGFAVKEDDKWRITVEKVGIFAHDIFNFDKSESHIGDILGCWDCEHKQFIIPNTDEADPLNSDIICLSNEILRDFRSRYGFGRDFLVLSVPKIVELKQDNDYVYSE